ncbi:hypothetical protein NYE40_20595 [Paenibacillus sp. FSL W8-1187]|uniref:hypothetical protein n=1 Tax=Paenibacillus sp. FSL W8-1187 TaxID=2975339 RepID=UPI0030DB0775
MNVFKEVADIQTADMLQLPVPKAYFHNVSVPPSEFQRDMVADLARRAEQVRAKQVEPHEDNMLTITNDGRKLALDQRLANAMLPDDEGSKVSACADNILSAMGRQSGAAARAVGLLRPIYSEAGRNL